MDTQKHVFISYSRHDTTIMRRVRDDLATAGFPVWTDERLIPGDISWMKGIEDAIKQAGALVLLMSPKANSSEWVQRELDFANIHNVKVFPALIAGTEKDAVPFAVVSSQYCNLQAERYPFEFEKMNSALRVHLATLDSAPAPSPVNPPKPKQSPLDDRAWKMLLERIKLGRCTLFLGPGVYRGTIPTEAAVARQWAYENNYPLEASEDLASVAQFLAHEYDREWVKEQIIEKWFSNVHFDDILEPDEPHRVLAKLPLPLYITANYDDYMSRALRHAGRNPSSVHYLQYQPENVTPEVQQILDQCSPDRPVIFHLYGRNTEPESMVLTEDDYLQYLVNFGKGLAKNEQDLPGAIHMPSRITRAFTNTALLFIGFEVNDWNFRVLFHVLSEFLSRNGQITNIAVQLSPVKSVLSREQEERVYEYLRRYFRKLEISVYIGDTHEFVDELHQRWEKFTHGA